MERLVSISLMSLQSFVDNPESITTKDISFQIAVASYPDTPRNLLEILANSDKPEVAEAARLHVNYAGELSENWQDVVDEKLKNRYLGQNDRLAVELLKIAPVPDYFLSEWVPPEYLIQGLSNPYLPLHYRLKLLERLAQEPTLEPRLQVAESPDTPLPVLEQLIGDLELPIRIAVQYNPHCPPELVKLVTGQHEVASNWDTDTQHLDSLSNSNWDWIRLAVAQNPSTSEETLFKLAGDKVFKIQLAVAKNPVTSANVLAVLAQHSSKEIQAEVAKHTKATEEILHSLFDTQQAVIKSRDNLPASIIERVFNQSPKDPQIPLFLSASGINIDFFTRQPNTPTWILAEFANIDLEKLRTYAEQEYPKSPIMNQVEGWISDRCSGLIELTKHPQVSTKILEQLAEFPNQRVKLAVAQNSKTPQSLKEELLKQLITNAQDYIKVQIASNPETPIEILEQLSGVSSSVNQMIEMLGKIVPDITANLRNEIKVFIDRHQSPELILFWLQQGKEFQASILDDWERLLASLSDREKKTLEYIASQASSVEWQGKFTVQRKTSSRSHHQLEPEKALLQRLMYLLNISYNSDVSNQDIIATLLGNPSTPTNLREQLWQKHKQEPDDMGRYFKDAKFRMALAYNTAIPEAERMEYFKQLIEISNDIRNKLAENPKTLPEIILKLFKTKGAGRQGISRNINAPVDFLAELAKDEINSTRQWVAKNPSTPLDILIELSKDNDGAIRHNALNNLNMPILERYRLLIEQEKQKEIEKSNQILAKRTDSTYALSRVLETSDRNAKLSAARNRKTPIQVLEQLAKDEDETVRSVMAQNLNLPLNTLLELAEDSSVKIRLWLAYKYTHSKIKTPVQLLEKLAKDESEQVRARVAEHPDTPVELLLKLANDPSIEVKKKLVINLNTPVTVLNRLGLEDNIVNKGNPNTPGEVLASKVKSFLRSPRQNDPRWKNLESTNKGLVEFLKHPVKGSQMPAETLAELADHHYPSVRYRVAAHPNTSTSTLEQLARDSYIATVRAVASNPNTPPSALEYLADNPDLTTRLSIVRHPNTPARVLRQIVENARQSANAPNTTKDSLKSGLFGDPYDLLSAIASNPRTPIDALEIIARREFVSPTSDPKSILPPRTDDDVIKSLVYNPSLIPELLNILTQDPCVDVRIALTRHPNLTEKLWIKLAEDKDISVRKSVATKTNVPVNILETLSQDTETDIRVAVAENINTPSQVLEQLCQDTEATVRTKVAANPNTLNNILETLAKDDSVEVPRAVANNSNSSEAIRNSLKDLLPASKNNTQSLSPTLRGLSRIYNPNTDDLPTVLSEYINSDVAFVRFVSLLHPLTPTEILKAASNSVSWLERYAVADNPNTPTEIKQQLTQDSNQIVRAVARS
jgi:hypothetical protein